MRNVIVSRALRSLSPVHQEILTETYFRRRTVNEASRDLGLPVETVKVRVYHAMRALHEAIDTAGVAEPVRH